MQEYVLGFAFDDLGRLALIKKARPEWQAGRLNGVGGKVEDGELYHEAMSREFREETGVGVPSELWRARGVMYGQSTFKIVVFTVTDQRVREVRTMTDEFVLLVPGHMLQHHRSEMIENLPSLIELCKIPVSEPSGVFPTFALTY